MKLTFMTARGMRVMGWVVLISIAGVWCLSGWISRRIESELAQALLRRGLEITWESSSWNPWQGARLNGIRLTRSDESSSPVAELGNLNLQIPLSQFFAGGNRITHWWIHDASITVHDDKGSVNLRQVSLKLVATDDQIEIERMTVKDNSLILELAGKISLRSDTELPTTPIRPDLAIAREILATLDVRPGTGPFRVKGEFEIDATSPAITWSGHLKGHGENLEWKGVRYTKVSADAEFTTENSVIRCEFHSANGSCSGVVKIPSGQDTPLTFEGTLRDHGGRENPFQGRYQKSVLTVESIEGEADLLAIARDVPQLAGELPNGVTFESFPQIKARNIRKSSGTPWTVELLEIRNSATVGFSVNRQRLEMEDLSAKCAFDGKEWRIMSSSARTMGGVVSVKGRYRDGTLRQSAFEIEGIGVSELKGMANRGTSRKGAGVLSGRFEGSVDFRRERLDGFGSVRTDQAPIIEVPLLDQVYELFSAMIPGVKRSGNGKFNADFKAQGDTLEVTRFEATGGASLTVSATGKVDLAKHRVSGRARGKLVGLPGLLTSPLSRLLEMDVAGPYDNIRVKPLGPVKLASNAVSGTVGVPLDALEETGRITGTLLQEGIKLPFEWMREKTREQETPDR